jgi:hypothetical protein
VKQTHIFLFYFYFWEMETPHISWNIQVLVNSALYGCVAVGENRMMAETHFRCCLRLSRPMGNEQWESDESADGGTYGEIAGSIDSDWHTQGDWLMWIFFCRSTLNRVADSRFILDACWTWSHLNNQGI